MLLNAGLKKKNVINNQGRLLSYGRGSYGYPI